MVFKDDLLAGINEFSRNGVAEKIKWDEFAARLFYIHFPNCIYTENLKTG